MGPMPAPIARIRGLFRFHLTLRGGPIAQVVRILRPLVLGQRTKEVDIQADVDPRSLM